MPNFYNAALLKAAYLLSVFILIISAPVISQTTMLDAAFGNGGKVITPINESSTANDIAIQPDGKIIAAGTSTI